MTPIQEIITAGSRFYGTTEEMLKGPCRERHIAHRRFSIMAACRGNGYTFKEIGDAFNRDHGSVMHAINQCCPEKFGSDWVNHQRFMTLTGCTAIMPEGYESAMREELGRKIDEIKLQIEILAASLAKLTNAHAQLQ
jgi:hypothetical protein